jgi:hypothetical protein
LLPDDTVVDLYQRGFSMTSPLPEDGVRFKIDPGFFERIGTKRVEGLFTRQANASLSPPGWDSPCYKPSVSDITLVFPSDFVPVATAKHARLVE